MHTIPSQDDDRRQQAAPTFASDAEIALAQQLRRKLEERMLTPTGDHALVEPVRLRT